MASNSSGGGAPGSGGGQKKFDGLKAVADLLGAMAPEDRQRMLANLAKTDPAITEKIKGKMLGFEDLLFLEESKMRLLLIKIPQDKLKLALRKASRELTDKILANMSIRASTSLKEELAAQGPQRESKVIAAQMEIVALASEI